MVTIFHDPGLHTRKKKLKLSRSFSPCESSHPYASPHAISGALKEDTCIYMMHLWPFCFER